MGRPPGEADEGDRLPAARTGLAVLPVDAEFALVASLQTGAADIIADAGAALVNRSLQDRDDGFPQAVGVLRFQLAAEASGPQFRLEQRLVRVDVADAGDDALVEEHGLEAAARAGQAFAPVADLDAPRLRTQAGLVEEGLHGFLPSEDRGAAE